MASAARVPQRRVGCENSAISSFKREYLENGSSLADTVKVLVTNRIRKSYMGFRLTPRSMKLDDLEPL